MKALRLERRPNAGSHEGFHGTRTPFPGDPHIGLASADLPRVHCAAMLRTVGLCTLVALFFSACAPTVPANDPQSQVAASSLPLTPVAVDDQTYAESAYRVLLAQQGTVEERMNLLAGVVRYQLDRAKGYFDAGHEQAGLRTFQGAVLLLRAGEHQTKIFEGRNAVLVDAVEALARMGNEGQSGAIYNWLLDLAKSESERDDAISHLDALEAWRKTSAKSGPLQAAGTLERESVQRALVDSSEESLVAARDAIVDWMHRALEADLGRTPIRSPEERDEAMEAYRAIKGGGATLLGLMLRHGRLRLALDTIEQEELNGVISTALIRRVELAVKEDDAASWRELFGLYDSIRRAEDVEMAVDLGVARGAAWGAALELHRSAPQSVEAAKPLAQELAHYGLAEVAARMLRGVYGNTPSAADLSFALGLFMQTIVLEEQVGQLSVSRRVYEEARPLLELAATKRYASRVQPSPARFEYVMGALELRAANLARAEELLRGAALRESSTATLESLAAIYRQRGRAADATGALERAFERAHREGARETEVRVLLALAEIQWEHAPRAVAGTLGRALSTALEARNAARSNPEQAVAERALAQVLDRFGRRDEARRAMSRACELSRSENHQLAVTLLDAARRALTYQDLAAARDAAHEAIDGELGDDDMVYVAVWLRVLELQLGVASDGTVERALGRIDDSSRWPAALRDWAFDRIDSTELTARAVDAVERTEALFYVTMKTWTGRRERIPDALRDVAKSEAVELMEVAIARDLVAERDLPPLALELPEGAELP